MKTVHGISRATILLALPFLALSAAAQSQAPSTKSESEDWLQVPSAVEAEHKELRAELSKLTQAGGKTGTAARKLQKELQPHFEKEEKYALPPLGLLGPLSQGKVTQDMRPAIALSDDLKAQLPEMLVEHRAIEAAARDLETAGREENQPEATAFAEKLLVHAQTEEQVLYPSAILVGEYLKLRLQNPTKD
jgi:hypothetical protein